jgi:hypothetical protein
MEYRFKFQIVDEDDNVAVSGSTYILTDSIDQYGNCESVDIEVGTAMRHFPTYLKALEIKRQEAEDELAEENECGKPHNNGRETCEECEIIKAGI